MYKCHMCDVELQITRGSEYLTASLVALCMPCGKEAAAYKNRYFDKNEFQYWGCTLISPHDIPPYPYLEDLRTIGSGGAWKIGYLRLERLINDGMVNSTGTTLTKKGLRAIA